MSERRDEILRIAGQLFAKKGFAATTVREIADEAGVLSGSLYHHFPSKDAIAEEILVDYYDGRVEMFHEVIDNTSSPLEALIELTRMGYRSITEQPIAVALIINSPYLLEQPQFKGVANIARELKEIWLKILDQAAQDGYLRPTVDPHLVYMFIRDAMRTTISWWRPEGKYSIYEVGEQFIGSILSGIAEPSKVPQINWHRERTA